MVNVGKSLLNSDSNSQDPLPPTPTENNVDKIKINKISMYKRMLNEEENNAWNSYNNRVAFLTNNEYCCISVKSNKLSEEQILDVKNNKVYLRLNYPLQNGSVHSSLNKYGYLNKEYINFNKSSLDYMTHIKIDENDIVEGKICKKIYIRDLLLRLLFSFKLKDQDENFDFDLQKMIDFDDNQKKDEFLMSRFKNLYNLTNERENMGNSSSIYHKSLNGFGVWQVANQSENYDIKDNIKGSNYNNNNNYTFEKYIPGSNYFGDVLFVEPMIRESDDKNYIYVSNLYSTISNMYSIYGHTYEWNSINWNNFGLFNTNTKAPIKFYSPELQSVYTKTNGNNKRMRRLERNLQVQFNFVKINKGVQSSLEENINLGYLGKKKEKILRLNYLFYVYVDYENDNYENTKEYGVFEWVAKWK